ncbi:MAG: hypothetical protein LBB58_06455 [Cellulomonadaceae bacterium]|jgi:hypothetical protein|nr:hypothetical protein [Cellulomonadaceae bacterium]
MATYLSAIALAGAISMGLAASPASPWVVATPVSNLVTSKLASQSCHGDSGDLVKQAEAVRVAVAQSIAGDEAPDAPNAALASLPYSKAQKLVGFAVEGKHPAANDCVFLVTVHSDFAVGHGTSGANSKLVYPKYTVLIDVASGKSIGVTAGNDVIDLITGMHLKPAAEEKDFSELHVSVSGARVAGSVLKAEVTSTPKNDVTYNYQWMRDGQYIVGATKASFSLKESDIGHGINVKVTAQKPDYATATVKSEKKAIHADGEQVIPLKAGEYQGVIKGRTEVTANVPAVANESGAWVLSLKVCNAINVPVVGTEMAPAASTMMLCMGDKGKDESTLLKAIGKNSFTVKSETEFKIGEVTFTRS